MVGFLVSEIQLAQSEPFVGMRSEPGVEHWSGSSGLGLIAPLELDAFLVSEIQSEQVVAYTMNN